MNLRLDNELSQFERNEQVLADLRVHNAEAQRIENNRRLYNRLVKATAERFLARYQGDVTSCTLELAKQFGWLLVGGSGQTARRTGHKPPAALGLYKDYCAARRLPLVVVRARETRASIEIDAEPAGLYLTKVQEFAMDALARRAGGCLKAIHTQTWRCWDNSYVEYTFFAAARILEVAQRRP